MPGKLFFHGFSILPGQFQQIPGGFPQAVVFPPYYETDQVGFSSIRNQAHSSGGCWSSTGNGARMVAAESPAHQSGQGTVHGRFQHNVGVKAAFFKHRIDDVLTHGGRFENQSKGIILEHPEIDDPERLSGAEGNRPGSQGMGQGNPQQQVFLVQVFPDQGALERGRKLFDQDDARSRDPWFSM